MDKSTISWFISDGRTQTASINKLLKRIVLVPYFEIMDNDDVVLFEDWKNFFKNNDYIIFI